MPAPIGSSSTDSGARRPAIPTDRCWTVPFVAACANVLFNMPETNSGFLYVLLIKKFGVNREAVSWPRTISIVMSNLMGFVIGAFQHRVSIYSMIVAGAFLFPAAIISSTFVPSIHWMMLTFGVFYGVSEGILVIATSVYTVFYFMKYRSAAMGLKYVGVSISGIVGPLLLSTLQEKYGFEGLFLVLGALNLNLIPLTLILKSPRPTKLQSRCLRKNAPDEDNSTKPSLRLEQREPDLRPDEVEKEHRPPTDHRTCSQQSKTPSTRANDSLRSHHLTSKSSGPALAALNAPDDNENADSVFLQASIILKAPAFYALLVPFVAADFTLPLFSSTIVDYARDKKVTMDAATILIMCLSTGGLCGRLVIPVLSDKIPHGQCGVASVSFVLVSLCFLMMPHLQAYPAIAVVTVITGLQHGYLSTIKAVLTADYLGVHSIPVSWGLEALVSLPLTFYEPSIVGETQVNDANIAVLSRLALITLSYESDVYACARSTHLVCNCKHVESTCLVVDIKDYTAVKCE